MTTTVIIITFIAIWIWIIWEFKNAPLIEDEQLPEWEKPYYIKENLFMHNGRTWEKLYNHPRGEKFRVFNSDMTDYDYKEELD